MGETSSEKLSLEDSESFLCLSYLLTVHRLNSKFSHITVLEH